ncbi:MAG: hypothetical protein JWN85_1728, partial [Gammaproteobacteria bacterium]|nr:hypothetical protein [Gammaproteobacteria bacterium]
MRNPGPAPAFIFAARRTVGALMRATIGAFTAAIANARAHERERTALRTRLAKIASIAPVAIFEIRTTPDGQLTMPYSTPAIVDIYGHTPEEL